MNKNSSKKSDDEKSLSVISPEKAKDDLVRFVENNKNLIASVRQTQENIGRMVEALDFKGMSERMALPLKLLAGLPEQIKSMSHLFEISVPNHFYDSVENIVNRQEITLIPRNDVSLADIRLELIKINQKLRTKSDEKFSKEANLKRGIIFDEVKSFLEIGGRRITIRKGGDQYHLLRIIFEDINELAKEWFYSEIAEKFDFSGKFDDKKFYNAAYQISQKIIKETGLRDVLLTTTHSIHINPDYLSET